MIHLNQAVVVEGKYDRIKLENIIDATIISTEGFGIFKNKEKRELLRTLSLRNGLIVITDSDSAGNMIRAHVKNICKDGKITNVYIPQILGKEKRKSSPSKEGFLGVEGVAQDIILEALQKSGVTADIADTKRTRTTKLHLYEMGLSGLTESASKRKDLAKFLNLPQNLSANAFLDIINTLFTAEEFEEKVLLWQETDKK